MGNIDVEIERECSSRGADRAIALLAERQHGAVARRQLLALGIGAGAIDNRVRLGRLHVVHRGVYAVGHRLLSARGRWMAAVLAAGPDAVLSHRSAAALWGLRRDGRGAVDVTVPRRLRGRPGIAARRRALAPDEVTSHDGIPVTTVPRTLFDLGTALQAAELENALHEAEVLRLTDGLSVADVLARHPHAAGSATVRRVLAGFTGVRITRSELERRFRAFLDAAGLPRPVANATVEAGGRRLEVDCLWPEERVVVELDGWAYHRTRRAYERDRERDRLLQAAGLRPVRVTWRQLDRDGAALAADLAALLTPGWSRRS